MSLDPEVAQRSMDFALKDGQMVFGVLLDSSNPTAAYLRNIINDPAGLANLAIALANADRADEGDEEEIDFITARDALLLSHQLDNYGNE